MQQISTRRLLRLFASSRLLAVLFPEKKGKINYHNVIVANLDYATKYIQDIMSDKNVNEEKFDSEDFRPPGCVASEYLLSQIRLDKPTESEVKEELQKQEKNQDDEPLREPTPCPSEYQLTKLNYMLAWPFPRLLSKDPDNVVNRGWQLNPDDPQIQLP
ncbi:hypothetical protein Y032_0082g1532 [Ancylostoma ceylanicum]|uniref:Uncharacterized protein n=1 Tax=Ancylostoma ceylanicum TaxID=53326 RepID=A0A016TRS1_9BILA|nr:hypothetical protein Y032_0082g1532 [Ancylostoma ceylanicum]